MEKELLLICKQCGSVFYYNYSIKGHCRVCENNDNNYDNGRYWYITKELIQTNG